MYFPEHLSKHAVFRTVEDYVVQKATDTIKGNKTLIKKKMPA